MKKVWPIFLGIAMVAFGIIAILYRFDILNESIFFDGWWTLFIIVPSFIALFKKGDRTVAAAGLAAGIFMLLKAQNIISNAIMAKIFLPSIIIIIGLCLIIRTFKSENRTKVTDGSKYGMNKNVTESENVSAGTGSKTYGKDTNTIESSDFFAFFASRKADYMNKRFYGARINAVFGSFTVDLSKADIVDGSVINATSVFGSVTIILPNEINAVITGSDVFGSTSDKRPRYKVENAPENLKKVDIVATNIFGGVVVS